MTLITRDQMRPGQIVQRVTTQTYRVCKRAGLLKLDQLPPFRAEWQLVRGRWRVRWFPPFQFLDIHIDGAWIAEEQDRRDGEDAPFVAFGDGDHEWYAFDTWAEAIAYADRMARQA